MIRSPVRPPARPVAIDGRVEPLQRARDVDALAAGGGQARARPMPVAELEVRHRERAVDCRVEGDGDDHEKKPDQMMHGPRARTTVAARRARASKRSAPASSGRDPEERPAGPDLDPPEPLLRARRAARRLPARRSARRAAGRRGRPGRAASRDERDRRAPVRRRRPGIRLRRDERERAVLRDAPREQPLQIGVPLRARRAAEDDRVDRVARCAARRRPRTSPRRRVTRLDADEPGNDAEQVVPRVHGERARPRSCRFACGRCSRTSGECIATCASTRDVARARHVTRRVEAVRAHEMRVAQTELLRALVHPADEARPRRRPTRRRERVGGVVRALDQRALRAGRAR